MALVLTAPHQAVAPKRRSPQGAEGDVTKGLQVTLKYRGLKGAAVLEAFAFGFWVDMQYFRLGDKSRVVFGML